jgi:hypothetical protein
MEKMGVRSLADLVRMAERIGISAGQPGLHRHSADTPPR